MEEFLLKLQLVHRRIDKDPSALLEHAWPLNNIEKPSGLLYQLALD